MTGTMAEPRREAAAAFGRIALLGNPNTGKTTLFNRLTGLRHKTANFPGTTLEARVGRFEIADEGREHPVTLIDLPGIYSLELDQLEAEVCRSVLEGRAAPQGEVIGAPTGVCIVVDASNLARNLMLVGEALRRRLPTVVALNMVDLAEKRGIRTDAQALERALGCAVVPISARDGDGLADLLRAMGHARIPNHTPPGTRDGLRDWAGDIEIKCSRGRSDPGAETLTDRIDRIVTHPVLGLLVFALVMAALFWGLFSLAQLPMGLLEGAFAALADTVKGVLPDGFFTRLLADGVIQGVGATVVFLPQICLLFFLISILEDTGYLARAAFVMDRALRPFGLPGHAFMPLLSSHACALPGIMATRAIPDRRERLATILVAPFMTCSARLPVYVLVTTVLFRDEPLKASLAFIGCYAVGIAAGIGSALLARRTILRGPSRPMALELPTYKRPSFRTALISTYDRAVVFLKQAGTNILAICIILWWLSAYPVARPDPRAESLRGQAAALVGTQPEKAAELETEADRVQARFQGSQSFAARLGRLIQPVFSPLGYDWQLTVGIVTSFAAREVFVSTMAVVVSGQDDPEAEGVLRTISAAQRDDGSPIFTRAVCWSLLVYYVLAMQCLPTLAVTAREAGGIKWALLQLAWMSGLAYTAALLVFQVLR
jgi:ferrous iron transport protein B